MRLILLAFAALLALAVPAAAKTVDHDIPAAFADVLPGITAKTRVPVLLPRTMPYDEGDLYASGSGRRRAWSLALAAAPDCGGATACFVASFSARKGARPHGR